MRQASPGDGGAGLAPMEQLLAFVDWERKQHPDKLHTAEWARDEIYRLHNEIDSAVKAERDRVCDLFLTEPISFPVGINTDADEIDASIKSDRFKLMTAVREGKRFKEVLSEIDVGYQATSAGDFLAGETSDDATLLAKARAVVIKQQKASISLVQRTLKIGYNQAARMLEDLEREGVVSRMTLDGRTVLVKGGAA